MPLIVRWPGVIQAGSICNTPVVSMDFYPTLLEAGELPVTDSDLIDGQSIVPLLRGEDLDRKAIYFHYPNYAFHRSNRLGSAIRFGRHKLIENLDDATKASLRTKLVDTYFGKAFDKKEEVQDSIPIGGTMLDVLKTLKELLKR